MPRRDACGAAKEGDPRQAALFVMADFNKIDLALGVLLALCALRGFWRGILREFMGGLGLLIGIWAAFRFAPAAAALLGESLQAPPVFLDGAAFVGTFVVVNGAAALLGALFGRLAGPLLVRGMARIGGTLVAVGKGAVVLSLVLLFLQLFPVFPALSTEIADSSLGRPMVRAAGSLLTALGPQPGSAGEHI